MPKIHKWHNMKKEMPILQKVCLIQTGEFDYTVATLEAAADEKGAFIIFMDWADNGGRTTPVTDVRRWAYLDLK